MRIAMLAAGFPPDPGGVEAVVGGLARELVRGGDSVLVLTHAHGPQQAGEAEPTPGLRVRRFRSFGGQFDVAPALVRALRSESPDVWHAHNLHSTLPGAALLARHGPLVVSPYFHGAGHSAMARLAHVPYRPVAAAALRRAAAVVSISAYEAALVRDRFGVEPVVIPSGAEVEAAAATVRTRADDGRIRLVTAGRLAPYKRHDALLRAMALLPAEYELVVVGRGVEEDRLRALAEALGVGSRVAFQTAYLSDAAMLQTWRDADLHVSLSDAESFSLAVLEALACGTPSVVRLRAALTEWAERFPQAVSGVAGIEPHQVADAIRAAPRARVQVDVSEFSWRSVADRFREVYAAAAGARQR